MTGSQMLLFKRLYLLTFDDIVYYTMEEWSLCGSVVSMDIVALTNLLSYPKATLGEQMYYAISDLTNACLSIRSGPNKERLRALPRKSNLQPRVKLFRREDQESQFSCWRWSCNYYADGTSYADDPCTRDIQFLIDALPFTILMRFSFRPKCGRCNCHTVAVGNL